MRVTQVVDSESWESTASPDVEQSDCQVTVLEQRRWLGASDRLRMELQVWEALVNGVRIEDPGNPLRREDGSVRSWPIVFRPPETIGLQLDPTGIDE